MNTHPKIDRFTCTGPKGELGQKGRGSGSEIFNLVYRGLPFRLQGRPTTPNLNTDLCFVLSFELLYFLESSNSTS